MSRVTSAFLARGALALFAIAAIAAPAQAQMGNEKLDRERYEQKLQTTRDVIEKERATESAGAKTLVPLQNVIDICRKNPKLPQCALQ